MRDLIPRTDSRFLSVVNGREPADLLIENVRLVNVFTRRIEPGPIAVCGGRIAAIGVPTKARQTIDAQGAYATPGLIDAHMHVESTMLMPSEFARLAVARGTTAAVLDPHEIANVLGIPGIRMLIDDAEDSPIHPIWMAPSCVPASHMETPGATLDVEATRQLLDDPSIRGLAEMMNFPGVVHAVPDVLAKVALGLKHGLVDGHAPGLQGRDLQAYVAAGVTTDHECTTADEAREKISRGMQIAIREGSAARNLAALISAITPETVHRFCFCTDDRHPGDLMHHGHIDHIIRRAVALGLDPLDAITIATINAANHYRQPDLGAIAPGRCADIVLVDDLHDFHPRLVLSAGRIAARDGTYTGPARAASTVTTAGLVVLPDAFDASSLRIPTTAHNPRVRVIGMDPHQLITESLEAGPEVHDGCIVADPTRDLAKLAVIERHGHNGNIGLGLIQGFRLARGALASTIGHDSHNLAVVGVNDEDMALAARAVAQAGGGQAVAAEGKVLAVLPLPIAGLISPEPAATVVAQQQALLDAAHSLGCPIEDPFMPLSFMPLVVIPHLKLSDKGLVDVDKFEPVPLVIDEH